MIDLADLPSDWAVWSIDKPVEVWEFRRWLDEMTAPPPPAESPLPSPPPAESPPISTPREMVERPAGEPIARKLYTAKDTAAILDITEAQLLEFVRHGELSYIDVGRGRLKPRRRFQQDDIDKFLAARRRTEEWPKHPAPSRSGRAPRSSNTGSGSVDESFTSRLKRRRAERRSATSNATTKTP
jgi:Helix-turn-helix domain